MLNQTRTKFGDRLLRRWLSAPLRDAEAVERRLDAVADAITDEAQFYETIANALKGSMDLERALTTIYYKKCESFCPRRNTFRRGL